MNMFGSKNETKRDRCYMLGVASVSLPSIIV
jgi:hypothetical protein